MLQGRFVESLDKLQKRAINAAALAPATKATLDLYQWMVLKGQAGAGTSSASVTAEGAKKAWQAFVADLSKLEEQVAAGAEAGQALARIPLAMGEALVAWHANDFPKARERFAEIIVKNPNCGSGPRIGLGLCLYRMGHIDAAKQAFRRALQVEPTSTPALSALSFLEAHGQAIAVALGVADEDSISNEADAQSKAVHRSVALAKRAVAASPDHPQALLELSHHYFGNWGEVVSQSTGTAVTATATRGSRRLILSDPSVLNRFKPNDTIKVLARNPRDGKPLLVPLRLTATGHAGMVDRSNLGLVNSAVDALPEELTSLPVLNCRQSWGLPSASSLPLRAINLAMSEKQARAAADGTRSDDCRAEAAYALGRALHASGNYVDAAIAYRNCLRFNRDHVPSLTGLAQCEIHQIGSNISGFALLSAMHADESKPNAAAPMMHLKRVLHLQPNDRTALKLLAGVYTRLAPHHDKREARDRVYEQAVEHARRASELAPWDPSASILYATLLQRLDGKENVKRAIKAVENGIQRLRERGNTVPSSLYNNLGVLRCRLGAASKPGSGEAADEMKTADELFSRSLIQVASEQLPGAPVEILTGSEAREQAMLSPAGVTTAFNIARLKELNGNAAEAEALYQRILGAHPSYLDCHIRLALLARARGDVAAANAHCDSVVATATAPGASPSSASALVAAYVLLGQAADAAGDTALARSRFAAAVAVPGWEHDPYSKLSLANLDMSGVYRVHEQAEAEVAAKLGPAPAEGSAASAADKARREKEVFAVESKNRDAILRRAFEAYKSVLKSNPTNIYAANGLGSVLAEQGRLEHAKEVFSLVREAAADTCPPVYVNLAHTSVALGNSEAGVQVYHQVLKKFGRNRAAAASASSPTAGIISSPAEEARVLLFIARAHVDARRFGDAVTVLSQAVELVPSNFTYKYNLAYCQEEEGVVMANKYVAEQQAITAALTEDGKAGSGAAASAAKRSGIVATITADDLVHALELVNTSIDTFKWLAGEVERLQGDIQADEAEVAAAAASSSSNADAMDEDGAGAGASSSSSSPALEAAQAKLAAANAAWAAASISFNPSKPADFVMRLANSNVAGSISNLVASAKARSAEAAARLRQRGEEVSRKLREKAEAEEARAAEEERRRDELRQAAANLKAKLFEKQMAWKQEDVAAAANKSKGNGASKKGKGKKSGGGSGSGSEDSDGEGGFGGSDEEEEFGSGYGGGYGAGSGPRGGKAKAKKSAKAAADTVKESMRDLFGSDSEDEGAVAGGDGDDDDSSSGSDSSGSDSDSSSGSSSSSDSGDSDDEGAGAGTKQKQQPKRTTRAAAAGAAGAGTAAAAQQQQHSDEVDLAGDAILDDLFGTEMDDNGTNAAAAAKATAGGDDDGGAAGSARKKLRREVADDSGDEATAAAPAPEAASGSSEAAAAASSASGAVGAKRGRAVVDDEDE